MGHICRRIRRSMARSHVKGQRYAAMTWIEEREKLPKKYQRTLQMTRVPIIGSIVKARLARGSLVNS